MIISAAILSFEQSLVDQAWYIKNGALDMDAFLEAFTALHRRHSEAWLEKYDFREVGRQLLLMAFLQRIVNSGGAIEREMALGNGRCDLLVTFGRERFLLELKLNRGVYSLEDGVEQICRYMDQMGVDHGYLILFEINPEIPWEKRIYRKELEQNEKKMSLLSM